MARIAMKDPEAKLMLIIASSDPEYMAYMMKYDSIRGRYDGTPEAYRAPHHRWWEACSICNANLAEAPFAEHGADDVCNSTGAFAMPAKDDLPTASMSGNQETHDPAVNGFGRAARQVARIAVKDPGVGLELKGLRVTTLNTSLA